MLCKILKDFSGAQDGVLVTHFSAGTIAEVSEYLFSCIDKSWVQVVEPVVVPVVDVLGVEIKNKAIVSDGKARKDK
jgi:hypothetical protein